MALWKDNMATRPTPQPALEAREPVRFDAPSKPETTPAIPTPAAALNPVVRADTGLPRKESLIAADLTIEGKIEGGGTVPVAGTFNGAVNVQGHITTNAGSTLTAALTAS